MADVAVAISRYICMFKIFTNLAALGTSLAQADGPAARELRQGKAETQNTQYRMPIRGSENSQPILHDRKTVQSSVVD